MHGNFGHDNTVIHFKFSSDKKYNRFYKKLLIETWGEVSTNLMKFGSNISKIVQLRFQNLRAELAIYNRSSCQICSIIFLIIIFFSL